MEQAITAEKRRFKRYSCKLKVYLQDSNELLGYAEDIQLQGMRLKSETVIPENTELKVWFGVDGKDGDRTKLISVSMYRVWSGFPDGDNRFYYSGMHFVPPSEETLDSIQELIDELMV